MDPEVARLVDIQAIRVLSALYNRAVDEGDADAFASVFTEDGRFETLGPSGPIIRQGREALEEMATRPPRNQLHTTTDAVVTVDGDKAQQVCSLACFKRPERVGELPSIVVGHYEDELVRTPAGWKFTLRRATAWF
ncbi:nuclear transport factor 2 family protein [Rhodococcus sp. NPDC057014]|uniref:nuclear transport factor 2 family protein n=1 Tax=Rhodococcus sp. NPDC057014 TaxID=3346000 RepID=UPI00363ED44D